MKDKMEDKRQARMIDADLLIQKINGMPQAPAYNMSHQSYNNSGLINEIQNSLENHINDKINNCFATYTNSLISVIEASVSEDLPCLFCQNQLKLENRDE